MIEYQGWMTVSGHWLEEYAEEFDYPLAFKSINDEFQSRFSHESIYDDNNCFIKLGFFNGSMRVTAIGSNNRKTNIFQNILSFFTFIQTVAAGSYGVFSFYDDEPSGEYKFHTYRFLNGECILDFDPVFSEVLSKWL